jgi:hypothetical protein
MELALRRDQAAYAGEIHEVRSLPELMAQLKIGPSSLLLIEATPENLEAVLSTLAEAVRLKSCLTAVALLDCPSSDRDILSAVLREAGACDIIHSPRHIRHVVSLGQGQASNYAASAAQRPELGSAFEDWSWSLLPWQAAEGSLG